MGRGTELSHRSDQRKLAGSTGKPEWQDLLQAESETAAWRLIEAFSQDGRPFQLRLSWSAGAGSGAWGMVTVAHAARICVFARTLTLRADNLAGESNRVVATVADGFASTHNQLEVTAESTGTAPVTVSVPPFATTVQVDVGDRQALAGGVVTLYDGAGVSRGQWALSGQPTGGIPLGGAARLEVTTQSSVPLRAIFQLSL